MIWVKDGKALKRKTWGEVRAVACRDHSGGKAEVSKDMAFMEWTENMSVGLDELDADHKMLIRVINNLAEHAGDPDQAQVLRQSIFALMRYAEVHFAREEQVMKACGYPELPEHQGEHKAFTSEIQDLAKRFDDDAAAAADSINEQLLTYLRNWLNHHIMIIDMAYRPFVEGKAEARKAAQGFKATEMWWGGR